MFRATVVPPPALNGKRRVKAQVKKTDFVTVGDVLRDFEQRVASLKERVFGHTQDPASIITCGECRSWWPEKNGYGLDLDGTRHDYGICGITGLPCKDNHYCGYASRRKE